MFSYITCQVTTVRSDNCVSRRGAVIAVQSVACIAQYFLDTGLRMSENENARQFPISTVRYGMGKEIRLYHYELVVTGQEEDKELRLQLQAIKRLTLMPGDPNPSKLILMADLDDDTTIILAEGMSNARDFRAMLPHIIELCPDIQLDPPDMYEQLRQALNTRRAWTLTCYGTFLLLCILLFVFYLVVAYIGTHH